MKKLKVYEYQDALVTFMIDGDTIRVDADEMAEAFGKKPEEWLQLKSTKKSLKYAQEKGLQPVKILKVSEKVSHTLMDDNFAVEFAHWLSPKFFIWFRDTLRKYYMDYLAEKEKDYAMDTLLITPEGQEKIRETLKEQQREREEQKAATALTNAYMNTTITVPVGRLAKILRDNGHKTLTIDGVAKSMSQTNILEWFRKNNVFEDSYQTFNAPKMEYILRGFFELTTYVRCKEGMMEYLNVPKVTGKGLVYYVNYFLTGKYPNIEGF